MKIALEYLYDSAYFNLKMMFIILIYNVLQTRIAKLGHFLLAFVLGRRIESSSEGMIAGVEMRPLASFLLEGGQVIGLRCDDEIGEAKRALDLVWMIVVIVCSAPFCYDD